MPEPMTILGNASAVMQLAGAIYTITKVKPDQELDELAREITSFGRACNLVRAQLEELGKTAPVTSSKNRLRDLVEPKLWKCFNDTIADCGRTIAQLDGMVRGLKDRQYSLEKKMRFLRKKEAMGDVRKRIHSNILALQLVLQSLNINVSHIAPQIANQQLLTKISDLRELIQKQESMIATLQRSAVAPDEAARSTKSHAEALIECARAVVSSGETLYSGSVHTRSTVAGSVSGDAILFSKERVADWFSNQTEGLSGVRCRSRTSNFTIETGAASGYSWRDETRSSYTTSSMSPDASSTKGKDPQPPQEDDQASSEDDLSDTEIEVDLLHNAMRASEQAFSKSKFHIAKPRLLASLEIIRGLPSKRRPTLDEVWQLRYKLAVCSFCIDDAVHAERALQEILHRDVSSDVQLRMLCHASHLLAQLYTFTNRLELARQSCLNALRGRRKLLGRKGHELFCSLALTSRILEIQGNSHMAREYVELIPESTRERYSQAYQNLQPHGEDGFRTPLDILLELDFISEDRHLQDQVGSQQDLVTEALDQRHNAKNSRGRFALQTNDSNSLPRPKWNHLAKVFLKQKLSRMVDDGIARDSLTSKRRWTLPQRIRDNAADKGKMRAPGGRENSLSNREEVGEHAMAITRHLEEKPAVEAAWAVESDMNMSLPDAGTQSAVSHQPSAMDLREAEESHHKTTALPLDPAADDLATKAILSGRLPTGADASLERSDSPLERGDFWRSPNPLSTLAEDRLRWLQALQIVPRTVLQKYITSNLTEKAMDLVSRGANDHSDGVTALHLAALFGDADLVSGLVANGADVNVRFYPSNAKRFYSQSANRYIPLTPNKYFENGATPLELAVAARKVETVRILLEKHTSYSRLHDRLTLPLWLLNSAWLNLTDCSDPREIIDVISLLRSVLDLRINERLLNGTFLLHLAVLNAALYTRFGNEFWLPVIDFLFEEGAARLMPNAWGETALHVACRFPNTTEIVDRLLRSSAADRNFSVRLSSESFCPLGLAFEVAERNKADGPARLETSRLLLRAGHTHGGTRLFLPLKSEGCGTAYYYLEPGQESTSLYKVLREFRSGKQQSDSEKSVVLKKNLSKRSDFAQDTDGGVPIPLEHEGNSCI